MVQDGKVLVGLELFYQPVGKKTLRMGQEGCETTLEKGLPFVLVGLKHTGGLGGENRGATIWGGEKNRGTTRGEITRGGQKRENGGKKRTPISWR